MKYHSFSVVWERVTCVELDNRHPYCGQLTAVKTGCPLISHMTVSRSQVPTHRCHVFFEVVACNVFQLYGSPLKLSTDMWISLQWSLNSIA